MSENNCGNCKFRSKTKGTCLRYPPTVTLFAPIEYPYVQSATSLLPYVTEGDWCGEWKTKEESINEISKKNFELKPKTKHNCCTDPNVVLDRDVSTRNYYFSCVACGKVGTQFIKEVEAFKGWDYET